MSYATPLSKSVSVSELLQMRENGMSNKEIARSLGVAYATVLAYIGKQPREITNNQISAGMNKHEHKPKERPAAPAPTTVKSTPDRQEQPHAACLVVESPCIKATGLFATYEIRTDNGTINLSVNGRDESLSIQRDELNDLVNELIAIRDNISDATKRNNTMW